MTTKFSKEELMYNLPDYIAQNIDDKNLIQAIQTEIGENPEFRSEFEDISKTLTFMSSSELSSPDEVYFNNLSVNINQRIHSGGLSQSMWERISVFWKIAVPAFAVIIIAILLLNIISKDSPEILVDLKDSVKTPEVEKNTVNGKKEIVSEQTPKISNAEDKITDVHIKKQKNNHSFNKSYSDNNNLKSNLSLQDLNEKVQAGSYEDLKSELYADNIENTENQNSEMEEDVLLSNGEYEEDIEEEYLELTPEQQEEILRELNNTQI